MKRVNFLTLAKGSFFGDTHVTKIGGGFESFTIDGRWGKARIEKEIDLEVKRRKKAVGVIPRVVGYAVYEYGKNQSEILRCVSIKEEYAHLPRRWL